MSNKQAAIDIVKGLRERGFEALLAGGCVRDMLLGRRAKDYDVATNARPEEVTRLFRRTLKVGAKFGVVIVLAGKQQVEVATFRAETGYEDGRHPGQVRFTSAAEDASRRDFTINGMFYDPLHEKVIDYVNGQADLQQRILRTIGEPQTYAAICRNAAKIDRISGERIAVELEGILVYPNRAAGTSMLIETGLAQAVFPGFVGEGAERSVAVLAQLRRTVDFPLALAAFFSDFPTDSATEKLKVLKLSRNQIKHVRFLLAHRGRLLEQDMALSRLKKLLAEPYFRDLFELERAIRKATAGKQGVAPLIELRRRIRALGDVEVKPKPLLDGHDLMQLGAVAGPGVGQLAEELYVAQLEGDVQTREQAEQWTRDWLQRHQAAGR
jgi:poly(A) polymerase